MRITQIVTTSEFAGTERYVVEITNELARRGHAVTVIGGSPVELPALLGPGTRWLPGADTRQASRSAVRAGRSDVVHSHIAKADFVAAVTAPRSARVSTRHITAARGYTRTARLLGRGVRRALDCEIAVSRWTSDQLARPSDVVLLNGVRPQPDVEPDREPVVLVAQRLAAEKDTETALRAWALADRAGWRLAIAGRGPQEPRLRDLARTLGVAGSVDFLGWVPDLEARYRTVSVLLAPAAAEPCGLSVIEAMAHGVAVVAADAAGHRETIGRVPGAAMFAPGDAGAAARALGVLISSAHERLEYGRRSAEHQRAELSLDGHVTALEEVYSRAVSDRRA